MRKQHEARRLLATLAAGPWRRLRRPRNPARPSGKAAERTCAFIYDDGTIVTATAVPDALSQFHEWKDLCKPFKSNPACMFPVEFNGDEVTAKFEKP